LRRLEGLGVAKVKLATQSGILTFGRRPAQFPAPEFPHTASGGLVLAKCFRFGALIALCALVSGCDPCGGPLKFSEFPKSCNYDQPK